MRNTSAKRKLSGPSVAASVVNRVLEFAVEQGAPRRELLAKSGIAPVALADHDNRIPLAQHIALLLEAKRLCGDPAFALHYGNAVNLAEASVVGLIGYACDTMLDAFEQLRRYSRLIMDIDLGKQDRFQLLPDDRGLWLIDNRTGSNTHLELTEIAFSQMVNGTRRFGQSPFVLELHVTHPDPGYRLEYERIFEAPVVFDSDRNAMRIDPEWLHHRVEQQPRYVFGVLSRHADALLEKLESAATTRGQVERLLLPGLHAGKLGINDVARSLGFSRDTLYRRLKAEGTTFAAILDELRHRLALDYIRGGKVSINETAYLLGFSDQAAFSRAFTRWTGHRPSRARASH